MASSLIIRSHHIDFDSVFRFDDAEMVQMFESLITTGLKEFLGCPAIFYENALTEFFANGSVRDGLIVSTIGGIAVEINESVFVATFALPMEGLTNLSEVPRNFISDAQSLFSVSEKEVNISCLKKEMKMQYRLLSDILAKSLFVKAGSFDAVTRDRFLLMTAITFDVKVNWGSILFGVLKEMVTPDSRQAKGYAIQICVLLKNIPGLELGESKAFPAPRILNEKTVHRIVSVNENVGVEEVAEAPQAKKTPVKKIVSKKRPAARDAEVAPVITKKRTTKSKPVAARRISLEKQVEDSSTSDQPVEGVATGEQIPAAEDATEDADATIKQVLNQLDLVFEKPDVAQGGLVETWFDKAFDEEYEIADRERQDTEEEIVVGFEKGTSAGDQPPASENGADGTNDDESLSIEEHQARIPFNASLPSTLAPPITQIRFGQAIDLKVLNLLSAAHLFALEDLLRNMKAHQLEWTRPSSSSLFEGPIIDRGSFIPVTHRSIFSKCWIRAKIMVDGSWLILEGVDYWRPISTPVNSSHWEALPQRPYIDDLAPLCVFVEPVQDIDSRPSLSRALRVVWAEKCMEAIQFSILGCLRPVCRELVVYNLGVERIPVLEYGGGSGSGSRLPAAQRKFKIKNHESSTCVTLNGSGIQLVVGPQPLWLRNHNFGLAQRIMVKRLATSPHDTLVITDSACKNQLVVVSVHYGPFNTYITIRSTTIGKSRVAKDPIAMHTSWRSNSDIASVTRVSMTFRVMRNNQYNQDLGLIHSTNGNHLESPNEGSSIDRQVTIYLHAQNITMFPTNETWYFASQILVSSSGGLILILTAQSTRNYFRIHSDY
ncbi:hypothetical protein F511_27336 [Dorcoceras hygrometricum]|uniref:Dystroglycan-like n=1 Tax=Dorcoceras hygrometricum TaxID=472368 RepID=A0A2Z7AL26_9LAMI|nr:hypothetical protein F511_27336 [Dorcoceras hygrometricum]